MSTNQNKALVTRFFDEMCNKRKLNIAGEIFSSTHRYYDSQNPADPGPEGMKKVIATYQEALPDAHWDVTELIAAEDVVITRWKGSGTQKKPLNGIPPTGKHVQVDGLWLHRIKDGKITESWNSWDTLGLLQQLGVVPKMGETATPVAVS